MAINDTTALGLPTVRPAPRRRRTLTGPPGTSASPLARLADVDATPLHPLVEQAPPAPAEGPSGLGPTGAASAPHEALLVLLAAHNSVAAELTLAGVLQKAVEAAREITGARYAALTLLAPGGTSGTVVQSGLREELVGAAPSPPADQARGDRLPGPTNDRSLPGSSPARSRCRSFTVPVTAQGSVLGHLRVSGPAAGRVFSAEDEDLVATLAVTAGIAVENVRLHEALQHREDRPLDPGGPSPRPGAARDARRSEVGHGWGSRVVRRFSVLGLALRRTEGAAGRTPAHDGQAGASSPPDRPGPRRVRP